MRELRFLFKFSSAYASPSIPYSLFVKKPPNVQKLNFEFEKEKNRKQVETMKAGEMLFARPLGVPREFMPV